MVVGESTDLLSAFPPNSNHSVALPVGTPQLDMVIVVPWRGARQSALARGSHRADCRVPTQVAAPSPSVRCSGGIPTPSFDCSSLGLSPYSIHFLV
jgi:hypothetical protein